MTGKAIGLAMGIGYAGQVSRTPDCVIVNKPVKSNSNSIVFGAPVVQNTDDTYSAASSVTVTAANFAGVAAAAIKQLDTYPSSTDDATAAAYAALQPCDVVKRGVVAVICKRGNPTTGGTVYVRTALSTGVPTGVIGDFEATADGGNSVALTNACWYSNRKDSNNVAELLIKNINN